MKSAIEQSIKEKIKALAKERETTFAELWRNLILERFLIRLSHSSFRTKFVLKGGMLLAKYLPLGRETQDLDFFIQQLSNTEQSLKAVLQTICDIDSNDSFIFEVTKIKILDHIHLAYTGAEVSLLAKFGATRTIIRIDLGFGDRVEPIDYLIDLIATSRGPLFESTISLYCYPKEFIFAEKLETLVFRGATNTRMKDFHDLYSLIYLGNLDNSLTKKALQLVFEHRKTPLKKLPIIFDQSAFETLGKSWNSYHRKLKTKKNSVAIPESIENVVSAINQWLTDSY
ncbi:MAG: nucleotidyl transferase AbiEii/AbiGii toxin family protein [Rhabdochlamydiaceae bacterium]|nr:nucleotidyl transferase AbiEii/AbiGii toxin family protein [Rhabdochlamydiaceae bacterium]